MRPILIAVVAGLGLVLKQAFELVLEREYATWAPALARLLMRVADFAYWPGRVRRDACSGEQISAGKLTGSPCGYRRYARRSVIWGSISPGTLQWMAAWPQAPGIHPTIRRG